MPGLPKRHGCRLRDIRCALRNDGNVPYPPRRARSAASHRACRRRNTAKALPSRPHRSRDSSDAPSPSTTRNDDSTKVQKVQRLDIPEKRAKRPRGRADASVFYIPRTADRREYGYTAWQSRILRGRASAPSNPTPSRATPSSPYSRRNSPTPCRR